MNLRKFFNKFLFLFCDNLKYLFILLGDAIFLIIYCNLFITSWISFGSFGVAMPELSQVIEALLIMLPYVVTHISPDIVTHRISGDSPKDLLVAPEWNLHKKWVLNGFDRLMRENNLFQGMNFSANTNS